MPRNFAAAPRDVNNALLRGGAGLCESGAMTGTDTPPAPAAPTEGTKLALVTGASRGLGAAMAEALAARGWHVLAVARTTGALEELDDRIRAAGGHATLAPMNVTEAEAMAHLAQSIAARWGTLPLWIHAAIEAAPLTPAGHIDAKDLDKAIATNIRATATLIAALEPLLRAGRGTAVFFADPAARGRFTGAYGATKAAQMAIAESWQAESERIGPQVRILTPAPMPTAVRARFFPGEDRSLLTHPRAEAERLLAEIGIA